MRSLLLLWFTALVLIAPAHAAPAAEPPPLLYSLPDRGLDERVSLALRAVPLREALRVLFRGTAALCSVGADVPDVPVTFRFPSTRRGEALQGIVRLASEKVLELELSTEGGRSAIRKHGSRAAVAPIEQRAEPAPEPDLDNRSYARLYGQGDQLRVDLHLQQVPLRAALDDLFSGSGLSLTVEKNVPDVPVTLYLQNTAFLNAVRWSVRGAAVTVPGLVVDQEERVFHVWVMDPPGRRPVEMLSVGMRDPGLKARKVTIDLTEAPLGEAFHRLFDGSGFECRVDPEVAKILVTFHVEKMSVPDAVEILRQQLSASKPGVRFRTQDDVFFVEPDRARQAPR